MNIMDHDQALKMHAAERYLLDELSAAERNDFEEHYFVCAKCADEVHSAFAFADNCKSVFMEETHTPRRLSNLRVLLRPAATAFLPAAAALLLCVTIYQSTLVIPRLQNELARATQPRVVPGVVAKSATRSEDPVVEVSERDQFVQVTLDILDINRPTPTSSYTCEIFDKAGKLQFVVRAPVPANGGSLNLLLPATRLEPERYVARVKPSSGTDSTSEPNLVEYSFVVKRK